MDQQKQLFSCQDGLVHAADALLQSYAQDGPLFLKDECISFPPRRTFDEAQLLYELFFPKYFNLPEIAHPINRHRLVEKIGELALFFFKGVQPFKEDAHAVCGIVSSVLARFADIRERLKKDVHAAYTGDPASDSYVEIIRCYPGILAIMVQRVAHELYLNDAKVYARELTELAHRYTGCDIHPGAKIGDFFFIDHATGTVIGETAELGSWCRLYQNVTIGALHFVVDGPTGTLKKGYKRHPTLGSNCVVGSGAKLLGNIRIGDGVSIGANSWVQENVPDNAAVFIQQHPQQLVKPKRSPAPTSQGTSPIAPGDPERDAMAIMTSEAVLSGRLTPSGVAPRPSCSPTLVPPRHEATASAELAASPPPPQSTARACMCVTPPQQQQQQVSAPVPAAAPKHSSCIPAFFYDGGAAFDWSI